MIEIVLTAFCIACTAVFLTKLNPVYQYIIKFLNIDKRPFNCPLCLANIIAIAYTIAFYTHLTMLFICPVSAVIALILEKLIVMLSAYL
ncbi:hypothetical protein GEO21_22390 [Sphingobacterium faecium]|uniref:hypothetical protein n=1 Tax=Sphingobacterium faecium TaxID=34087 RepID=UPI001291C07F|nr:hypothetical protein [Sphingobacterium faecium]MQP30237.1 hypothetical protein [Sphingobacterium faecium]